MSPLKSIDSGNSANPAPFTGIDIAKFVASILVIAIHTYPFSQISAQLEFVSVDGLARVAVPFFFLCSGYFYVRGAEKKGWGWPVLWNYLKRLLVVYGIWSLIYLPLAIHGAKGIGLRFIGSILYQFVFIGIHIHFWYFPALVFSIILLHTIFKRLEFKYVLTLGVLLYLLCMLGDSFWEVGRLPVFRPVVDLWISRFSRTRNALPGGFLFVAIGAWSALRQPAYRARTTSLFALLFLIAWVIESVLTEKMGLARHHNSGVFLAPASVFIFLTVLKWNPRVQFDPAILRNISVIVYCIHPLLAFLIQKSAPGLDSNLTAFSITAIASCGLGYLIVKSRFKFLRTLY